MKAPYSEIWRERSSTGFRHLLGLLCLWALVISPRGLYAQAPAWWAEWGAVNSQAQANDFAAVNQGQLKNMAKAAMEELDAHLPGGAGYGAHDLVDEWDAPSDATDDYAAVNLGQLKNAARPFYDQLTAAGYAKGYPWTASALSAPNDFALANIGQVKNLFSFDIRVGAADPNGLPGWWQQLYFGHSGISPSADEDGDGLTNVQEYSSGTNPGQKDNAAVNLEVNVIIR